MWHIDSSQGDWPPVFLRGHLASSQAGWSISRHIRGNSALLCVPALFVSCMQADIVLCSEGEAGAGFIGAGRACFWARGWAWQCFGGSHLRSKVPRVRACGS